MIIGYRWFCPKPAAFTQLRFVLFESVLLDGKMSLAEASYLEHWSSRNQQSNDHKYFVHNARLCSRTIELKKKNQEQCPPRLPCQSQNISNCQPAYSQLTKYLEQASTKTRQCQTSSTQFGKMITCSVVYGYWYPVNPGYPVLLTAFHRHWSNYTSIYLSSRRFTKALSKSCL